MTTRKSRRSKARRESKNTAQQPATSIPAPILMEQGLRDLTRVLESSGATSSEEVSAALRELLTINLDKLASEPETPLDEAQELVFEAMEATGKRRYDLARKALEISPDCADAYALLAEKETDPNEVRRLYEEAVAAGERALGADFEANVGQFWLMIETRPYMRARFGLASVLWEMGEREAAIGHLREMLRLNPGDNQGVRYLLASWLLISHDDAALERLLEQYPDEWSAQWAYTKLLLTLRRHGTGIMAETALDDALATNPYVPLYLFDLDPLPDEPPEYYSPGDRNEAILYLGETVEAWVEDPETVAWLGTRLIRKAVMMIAERGDEE